MLTRGFLHYCIANFLKKDGLGGFDGGFGYEKSGIWIGGLCVWWRSWIVAGNVRVRNAEGSTVFLGEARGIRISSTQKTCDYKVRSLTGPATEK